MYFSWHGPWALKFLRRHIFVRKSKHIRHFCYLIPFVFRSTDTFKEQTDVSKYDVFVSYCGRDFSWVQDNLLPLLDTYQLKYCIHTRDFEVGKPILHNMADSVFGSRVTVAVISSSYMTSKFCQEELSMAVCKSMAANRPSLLAIRIDSVSRKKLPKNLRRTTFLDYIDSTEQQTWDRRLIKHLLSHIETGKSRERKFKLDLWPHLSPHGVCPTLLRHSHLISSQGGGVVIITILEGRTRYGGNKATGFRV